MCDIADHASGLANRIGAVQHGFAERDEYRSAETEMEILTGIVASLSQDRSSNPLTRGECG